MIVVLAAGTLSAYVLPDPACRAAGIRSAAAWELSVFGTSSNPQVSGSSTAPGSSQMMDVPSGRVRNPT